jgi:hypothetical protein
MYDNIKDKNKKKDSGATDYTLRRIIRSWHMYQINDVGRVELNVMQLTISIN